MKMMKDLDLCPGGNCPLRMSCERHHWWMQIDDDIDGYHYEIEPMYNGNECELFVRNEYFYGG